MKHDPHEKGRPRLASTSRDDPRLPACVPGNRVAQGALGARHARRRVARTNDVVLGIANAVRVLTVWGRVGRAAVTAGGARLVAVRIARATDTLGLLREDVVAADGARVARCRTGLRRKRTGATRNARRLRRAVVERARRARRGHGQPRDCTKRGRYTRHARPLTDGIAQRAGWTRRTSRLAVGGLSRANRAELARGGASLGCKLARRAILARQGIGGK